MMRGTDPEIRVLPAERGWARNLDRQAGLATTFVLGMAVTHWSRAFGLALAGTVVLTMCLMRGGSTYQRSRFRKQPDRALASRNGIAGEFRWDRRGVRWVPRKAPNSGSPFELAWSQVDYLTIQPLTGLIDACRVVVEPGADAFVLTAPASDVALHVRESFGSGGVGNPT